MGSAGGLSGGTSENWPGLVHCPCFHVAVVENSVTAWHILSYDMYSAVPHTYYHLTNMTKTVTANTINQLKLFSSKIGKVNDYWIKVYNLLHLQLYGR